MTERPTRLRVIRDTVPEGVEAAVAKALSKVPSDRFGSAAAFTAALSEPSRSAPAEPEPERTPARRFPTGVVVTLLVVGLTMAGALLLRRPAPAPPPSQRQLTFTGRASQPAISPDGKRVAYVVSGRSLVVQSLDGGEPIELVPPARFLFTPRWTRDGSALLFTMFRDTVVNGQIKLAGTWMVPSGGGPPREVLPDVGGFDAGPDSLTAIWAQPAGIEAVELPSGDRPLKIRTSIPTDSLGLVWEVAWSPDRRWIAFMTVDGFVGLVSAAGGEPRRIARTGRSPRWGPSGRTLYFLQDTSGVTELRRVAIDPGTGVPQGSLERVLNLPSASEFDLRQGTLVYTQQATSQQAVAFTLAPGGGLAETHTLTQGTATVGSVSITTDGSTVAYDRSAGGKTGIAVVPFAGGPPQVLSGIAGNASKPIWAPDGATMAFINTDSTGKSRVMVARFPDGSARPVGTAAPAWSVSWSGDGRWLAYPTAGGRRIALLDLRSQGESFESLPDSLGYIVPISGIALSADGKQLVVATMHRRTDWFKLAFAVLDKHSWRRIPEPFGESGLPRWGSDGWLYLLNERALMGESGRFRFELWRTRPPEGTPQFLAELPEGSGDCSIAADGRRGACVRTSVTSDLLVVMGLQVEDRH
jgi:Tol biopolymer transport system component